MNSWFIRNSTSLNQLVRQFLRHPRSTSITHDPCLGWGLGRVEIRYPWIAEQVVSTNVIIICLLHQHMKTRKQTVWDSVRHYHYHSTTRTCIDLIDLKLDTFAETGSQQTANWLLGCSSHFWEINKISAIHRRFALEKKTIFGYVFKLDDQAHIYRL